MRRRRNAAIVRATCTGCGDVEVIANDTQVLTCINTGESTYAFGCPKCGLIVNKPANDAVVSALISANAKLVLWQLPAELSEPHHGERITHDYLLEFHLGLQAMESLDKALAS